MGVPDEQVSVDPLDSALYSESMAVDLVLGRDRFCRKYLGAYREGKITA